MVFVYGKVVDSLIDFGKLQASSSTNMSWISREWSDFIFNCLSIDLI